LGIFGLPYQLSMLAIEANQAIFLRTFALAGGGGNAEREARLMVEEKLVAMTKAHAKLSRGASPEVVVQDLRKTVRANVRRLSKAI
jgi:hypothetical protein